MRFVLRERQEFMSGQYESYGLSIQAGKLAWVNLDYSSVTGTLTSKIFPKYRLFLEIIYIVILK